MVGSGQSKSGDVWVPKLEKIRQILPSAQWRAMTPLQMQLYRQSHALKQQAS